MQRINVTLDDETVDLLTRLGQRFGTADRSSTIRFLTRYVAGQEQMREGTMQTKATLSNILAREDIRVLRTRVRENQERASEESRRLAGYQRHDLNQFRTHPERGMRDLSNDEAITANAQRASTLAQNDYAQAINAACVEAGLPPYFIDFQPADPDRHCTVCGQPGHWGWKDDIGGYYCDAHWPNPIAAS